MRKVFYDEVSEIDRFEKRSWICILYMNKGSIEGRKHGRNRDTFLFGGKPQYRISYWVVSGRRWGRNIWQPMKWLPGSTGNDSNSCEG
ncbi:hypothetical protein V1477_017456 [Vespula maculifrons]|uniref:Uncharacterized protein n=2 Tax=Vespula TaxID=7451 RepID=A0A834K5U1_VESVU|nr:hypothetical protein HZH66_005634 [Vespula vulgaris]